MDPSATHGLWADLHRPDLSPAEADFSIIGIPYDGMACARKGAARGPERIRFWSGHMTPFSEDRTRLEGVRICDLGNIEIKQQTQDFELVRQKVAALPNVPIVLGGDHSVSIPIFQGQRERFKDKKLGVLWLDAHPDLCDVFTAADVAEHGMQNIAQDVRRILSRCEAIHISCDIDCLDPAFAPGTGIPDSGGLTAREVITLIKSLKGLPLIGLDMVEVAPPLDPSEATVFTALKIIMEFIAVVVRAKAQS